jgi:hypothetical protein
MTSVHASGIGGSDSYRCISILPTMHFRKVNPGRDDILPLANRTNESVRLGYYNVILDSFDAQVELSATPRGALHRYTWLANGTGHVVIDFEPGDQASGGWVQGSGNRVWGTGQYRDSWSMGLPFGIRGRYDVSICAEIDEDSAVVEIYMWNSTGFYTGGEHTLSGFGKFACVFS